MRAIKDKRKNKKPLIILTAVAVLAVVGGACAYFFIFKQPTANNTVSGEPTRPANDVNYEPPSPAEQQIAEQQKEETVTQNTTPPAQQNDITISLVRADQAAPGEALNVRIQIDGTNSGTCEVALSKDGSPAIKKTFTVVHEAGSRYCQNADIAANDFAQSGNWQLKVYVQNGNHISNTIEQAVTITK